MSRRASCSLVWGVLSLMGAACGLAQGESGQFEIWLIGSGGERESTLRQAVDGDLARTPRRHDLLFAGSQALEGVEVERLLAVIEFSFDPALPRPRIEFAATGEEQSPGWLIHAILRAASAVEVDIDVVDSRSSWLGQLIRRSTRHPDSSPADSALALGVPAVKLVLPAADAAATGLLASAVRRLDGLDGYPLFEDQFLVVGERVLLRRDLYWIGLAVWLALYWRGRKRPGREFRWLLLAAWLVAPVYSSLLLLLPAVVATWRPAVRWPAAAGLLPAAVFVLLLALAVAGPEALVVSVLPALLVLLAVAAFVWHHLVLPPRDEDPATG